MRELPRYQSHKKVWALKIAQIEHLPNPDVTGMSAAESYGAIITPVEDGYAPFKVSAEYMLKHKPKEGGYYVQYEGGYQSYSPADAFEGGYRSLSSGGTPIEQAIQAKGMTAPRVTPADIETNIASEHYFTAADGVLGRAENESLNAEPALEGAPTLSLLTFCVLVLKNGFTVTGESACASPENFDAEIGRQIARKKAVEKCWPLLGYELRSKLAATTK